MTEFKEENMPKNYPPPSWMIRYDCKEQIRVNSVEHARELGVDGVTLDCVKEFFFCVPMFSLTLCPFSDFDLLQSPSLIHGFKLHDPLELIA